MRRFLRHARLALVASAAVLLHVASASAQDATRPTGEALAGLEFRTIGPANMSGRIVDLAVVEKDPYTFYAASATGGVWKTTTNGITFEPVFERQGTHSVGDVAVHQQDTSVVWVGTGERASRQSNSWGDGVYKSTDGGETWTHMGLEETRHVGRIRMHPTDPDIVFVAAMGHLWGPNEERGLYKSTDGGESWRKVLYVDERTGVVDVAIDHTNPETMYAASYQRRRRPYGFHGGGPGSALWKSTDGGETWEKLGPAETGVPEEVAAYEGEGDAPTVHGENGLPRGDYGRLGITIYRSDPRIVFVSIGQGYRFNASTAYIERRAGIYRSMDRGETWERLTDWNPRPMYASQPLVDPNDPNRIYMMNRYSWWDETAKEVVSPRQSLHGDDRLVWVNPADSRHVIKADDGGVGISYDRGRTWLYVTSLPVSQFYRIAVDNMKPYNVYGGLQDNGTWMGPSATYRWEGVLNEDWTKVGGGDGFLALPDTTDPNVFYTESQYLGLTRYRRGTLEDRDIRPGDPTGHIGPRRNFDVFFERAAVPELGNAMAPANWDGPYIISPHDPNVLYAGTDRLWKSEDRGTSWTDLGRLTSDTDRRELEIMGQGVGEFVPSIDDGIPYWPTLTVIAESPLRRGVLYVGTDDGRLLVSRNDGESWDEISDRLPGMPDDVWVNGIEPSRHVPGRVYVVVNNYRNDDYANYLYRSDDFGRSWTAIVGDLPAERVLRTVREDRRNPDVLWLGAELGLFASVDGGGHWFALGEGRAAPADDADGDADGDAEDDDDSPRIPPVEGLPTVAVNDLVVHPRDNDLVIGTHGRGVWILDNVNAIQELTPEVLAADAHLFTLEPAEMIRYASVKAHTGDMIFRGENPPAGAIIDYWLGADPGGDVALTVHDANGRQIRELEPTAAIGANRVIWDLRHSPRAALPPRGETDAGDRTGPSGPLVVPGTYTVRLAVGGETHERPVEVREDPRLEIDPTVRAGWTRRLLAIGEFYDRLTREYTTVRDAAGRLEESDDASADALAEAEALERLVGELHDRTGSLYWQVDGWTGTLTADQRSRLDYYQTMMTRLAPRIAALADGAGVAQ